MRWKIPVCLVVTAVLSAAAAAPASAVTYGANCGNTSYLDYKNNYWSAGCTGGSLNISKLKWTRWGDSSARGRGRAQLRDPECRPTCPEAKLFRYSARVTFSRPRTCRDDAGTARRYFSRVTVRIKWTPGNPFKKRAGWGMQRITILQGTCTLS
jgi:hypothetical protein